MIRVFILLVCFIVSSAHAVVAVDCDLGAGARLLIHGTGKGELKFMENGQSHKCSLSVHSAHLGEGDQVPGGDLKLRVGSCLPKKTQIPLVKPVWLSMKAGKSDRLRLQWRQDQQIARCKLDVYRQKLFREILLR